MDVKQATIAKIQTFGWVVSLPYEVNKEEAHMPLAVFGSNKKEAERFKKWFNSKKSRSKIVDKLVIKHANKQSKEWKDLFAGMIKDLSRQYKERSTSRWG